VRRLLIAAFLWCGPVPVSSASVDFSHEVAPILRQHCGKCHLGSNKKGGLSFNTRAALLAGGDEGEVLIPGKSSQSRLIAAIRSTDPDTRMPPQGTRLSDKQVSTLEQWINSGATWDEGFVFQKPSYEPPLKPRRPELPPVEGGRANPIDRLIDADLKKHNQPRPKPLDDIAFARRASLDLTGLLPAVQPLQKFLADKSFDRRERWIRKLLADDTAYAEHWLTFWNDLLRNDYGGTGFITGGRKQISNWLYQALIDNKPYDQMVRELIAPTAESAGFADGIRWRGTVSAGQTVEIQFAQSVGQVFLGINLKCASCHDSFVDRWKLDEAYGMAAIYATTPLEISRCDKPIGRHAKAGWLFPELGEVKPTDPQPDRLKQLAALMTHPDNGRVTRTVVNRLWHRMMGRGIVHPVDAMQTEPWNADLLDWLAVDFADHDFNLKHTLELIATSAAYQSQAEVASQHADDQNYVYSGPRAKRLTAEQFVDAVWQITGAAPKNIDAPITRKSPVMTRASLLKSDFLQRTLGRPNRDQIVTTRPTELSTLEAIDLNNAQVLADNLATGAGKWFQAYRSNQTALVNNLYLAMLSRSPTDQERSLALESLSETPGEQGVADLLWAILVQPEFQLVR
jgi:hypothetical protein